MSKYRTAQMVLLAGVAIGGVSIIWWLWPVFFATDAVYTEDVELRPSIAQLEKTRPDFLHTDRIVASKWLEDMYYARGKAPFMEVSIFGLNSTYKIGDRITFTAVEAGFDNNFCTAPHFIVKNKETGKIQWEYWAVRSCLPPTSWQWFPILNYHKIPSSESQFPPITEAGDYVIRVESKYDSFAEKEISVLESEHVFDYNLVYTRIAHQTGKTITTKIDLNSGKFTTPYWGGQFEGRLSQEELDDLKKTIYDNNVIGSITAGYGVGVCDDCMFNRVEINLDRYKYTLEWYDGSMEISKEHSNLIKAVNKVNDSITTKLASIR
ncbi:MAG: hypothetical protein QW177_05170 [Candidatus Nitrosotenuis sp.]